MALNSAGVSSVAIDNILFNDVQDYLIQEAVIAGTIKDFTSKIKKGDKSINIPKVSGLGVTDVKQDGTEAVSSAMALGVDKMDLDQFKEVAEFIYEGGSIESTLDLKAEFLDAAPRIMSDYIDAALYAGLKSASAASPDHIIQLSESTNTRPSLANIQNAGLLLNKQNVPRTDRYLIVSPEIKIHLLAKAEIQDASKSGSNSALINGEFARIFGFILLESNNITTAAEMVAYHGSCLAWGMQKEVEFVEEKQVSKGREFLAVRTKYGLKALDSGKRQVLFNATGA